MAAIVSLEHDNYLGFQAWIPCIDACNINNGDLVWWDATNQSAKAGVDFTYSSSDAQTRRRFKRVFLGVMNGKKVSGDGQLQVQVVNGKMKATVESSTALFPGASATGGAPVNLVGISCSGSACLSQQLKLVNNPDEAIGTYQHNYTSAVTELNDVFLFSHLLNPRVPMEQTIWLPAVITTGTGAVLTIDPYKLFGGAAEVLAFGFQANKTALTVTSLIANLDNGGTNLANLTVTTGVGVLFGTTEVDLSGDAARIFVPGTNLAVEISQSTTAGEGSFYIRYRPLFN